MIKGALMGFREMAGLIAGMFLMSAAAAQPVAEIDVAKIPTGYTATYSFLPEGSGPYPAIFFLQGYPCRTAAPDDERNLARNKLIMAFVEAGYLVHIAEKPGVGGSVSSKPCKDLLYSDEVAAFAQVLDQLRQDPRVDSENLYIFGHSMGGQTAPLIASGRGVKGIITYGIHAKPWFEFMIDITRAQAERIGIDPVAAQADTRKVIPFLYDLMIAKRDWAYLRETHADALSVGVFRAEGEYLNGRHYRFWADLNDAGFVDAWAAYKGRVLAMYGEYDIASISSEGAERIARIVNRHHPGNAKAFLVPKTGHGFATIDGTFEEYLPQRLGPDWAGTMEASLFNEQVPKRVIDWLNQP